jgi:hypothetical protein
MARVRSVPLLRPRCRAVSAALVPVPPREPARAQGTERAQEPERAQVQVQAPVQVPQLEPA